MLHYNKNTFTTFPARAVYFNKGPEPERTPTPTAKTEKIDPNSLDFVEKGIEKDAEEATRRMGGKAIDWANKAMEFGKKEIAAARGDVKKTHDILRTTEPELLQVVDNASGLKAYEALVGLTPKDREDYVHVWDEVVAQATEDLQSRLKEAGAKIEADGRLGSDTLMAIQRFGKKDNVPQNIKNAYAMLTKSHVDVENDRIAKAAARKSKRTSVATASGNTETGPNTISEALQKQIDDLTKQEREILSKIPPLGLQQNETPEVTYFNDKGKAIDAKIQMNTDGSYTIIAPNWKHTYSAELVAALTQ